MSNKKRKRRPREIRIGDERFIPVVLSVVTRHPNGRPSELQCQESDAVPYHLPSMEAPQFVVVYALDKCFPGFDGNDGEEGD